MTPERSDVEIVNWDVGRLAVTGTLAPQKVGKIAEALRSVPGLRKEMRSPRGFTYSFPARFMSSVVKVIETLS